MIRPIEHARHPETPPMIRRGSLRTNFSWSLAGNVVLAASQFGVLIVLARLGSPAMVGQFAYGLAVAAPVFILANLGLRNVQASDTGDEHTFGDYLTLRIATTLLGLLAIGALLGVVRPARETALVIALVGVAKAFDAVSDIYHGLYQRVERMTYQAAGLILNGVGTLVALAAAVALTDSIVAGAAASALVSAVTLLGYNVWAARRVVEGGAGLQPRLAVPLLRGLAWMALPVGLAFGIQSFNLNMPRYFVQHELGEAELGIFAALAYMPVAGYTVVSALAQASLPRLSRLHATGDRAGFRGLLLRLNEIGLGLGLLAIVLVALLGRPVLDLIYGAEYAAEADILFWLAVAMAIHFLAWFCEFGLHAARRFAVQFPIAIVVAVTNLIAGLILVPEYGLLGGALVALNTAIWQLALKGGALLWAIRAMPPVGEVAED